MTVPTLEETVARMKAEISADIAAGVIASPSPCFADLHDYVDANYYGGFCEDDLADKLIEHFGGRDADEGLPQGFLDYMNAAQDAVSTWLAEGEPKCLSFC